MLVIFRSIKGSTIVATLYAAHELWHFCLVEAWLLCGDSARQFSNMLSCFLNLNALPVPLLRQVVLDPSDTNSLSSDMLTLLPDMSSLSHDSSIGLLEFLGFPLGSLWEHFSDIWVSLGVSIGSLWVPFGSRGTPFGPLWGHFGGPWLPLGHYFGDFGSIWTPKSQYFLINTPKYKYIHIFI